MGVKNVMSLPKDSVARFFELDFGLALPDAICIALCEDPEASFRELAETASDERARRVDYMIRKRAKTLRVICDFCCNLQQRPFSELHREIETLAREMADVKRRKRLIEVLSLIKCRRDSPTDLLSAWRRIDRMLFTLAQIVSAFAQKIALFRHQAEVFRVAKGSKFSKRLFEALAALKMLDQKIIFLAEERNSALCVKADSAPAIQLDCAR